MDDLDLDAIRARAIAAGGADERWKAAIGPACNGVDALDGNTVVSQLSYDEGAPTEAQAAHIAGMDPATTLALLDEIDRLRTIIAPILRSDLDNAHRDGRWIFILNKGGDPAAVYWDASSGDWTYDGGDRFDPQFWAECTSPDGAPIYR